MQSHLWKVTLRPGSWDGKASKKDSMGEGTLRGAVLEEVAIREFWNVKVGKVFSAGSGFPLMNQLHSTGGNVLEPLDEKHIETESRLSVVKNVMVNCWCLPGLGRREQRDIGHMFVLPVLILPSHFTDSINEAQSWESIGPKPHSQPVADWILELRHFSFTKSCSRKDIIRKERFSWRGSMYNSLSERWGKWALSQDMENLGSLTSTVMLEKTTSWGFSFLTWK